MSQCLLGEVVGRLIELGIFDETKKIVPMFNQPLLHGESFALGNVSRMNKGIEFSLESADASEEIIGFELFSSMPESKEKFKVF